MIVNQCHWVCVGYDGAVKFRSLLLPSFLDKLQDSCVQVDAGLLNARNPHYVYRMYIIEVIGGMAHDCPTVIVTFLTFEWLAMN